jgi:hypothetical protein
MLCVYSLKVLRDDLRPLLTALENKIGRVESAWKQLNGAIREAEAKGGPNND